MIESLSNDRIKEYTKLNQKKYRDDTNMFIIEGTHLVEEAIKNDIVVEAFSLDDKYTQVSEEVMKKLSNLDTPPKYLAVCNKIEEKEINGNVLVLDGVQDPGNLGTIIRRDLNEILPTLKDKYTIYTTNVVTGTELKDISVKTPYVLIMGSEGKGVKDSIASYADESVYINMNDKCESLNVGVATSIILYEFNE